MKSLLLAIPILLFSLQIFCQDSSNYKKPKFQFSFEIGAHYNYLFGKRFINPVVLPQQSWRPYVGYTKVPTTNIQAGFLLDYSHKKWNLTTGLVYYNRSKIYISDSTTLGQVNEFYKQYNHHSGIPYYNNNINITRYDYSPNNIDMPLYLGYKINRIEFEIGVNISILKFTNTSETYSNGSLSIEKQIEYNRLLNLFIKDYKFPMTAKVKFGQCGSITFTPKK